MKKFLLVFLSVSLLSGCVSSVSFNTGFIPPPRHYYSTTESVSVITAAPVTNGQTIVEEVIIPKQTVVIEKTYPVYPALSVGFFILSATTNRIGMADVTTARRPLTNRVRPTGALPVLRAADLTKQFIIKKVPVSGTFFFLHAI